MTPSANSSPLGTLVVAADPGARDIILVEDLEI
jgi:hypothetical protein